jgi:hypothetical protein
MMTTVLKIFTTRRELSGYDLARCNDGSTAAYYHQQVGNYSIAAYFLLFPYNNGRLLVG